MKIFDKLLGSNYLPHKGTLMEKYQILLVDDHQILLEGTFNLLNNSDLYNVKSTANSGEQAIELLKNNDYDIMITDYEMKGTSGLELTKVAKKIMPEIKVIVLSMHDDPSVVRELLRCDISSYVLKNDSHSSLLTALEKVAEGKKYFSDEISAMLVNQLNNIDNNSTLSPRETEILKLIAKDYSTKQIAEILFISERTVETHRKNILRKTECNTVVGLVNYAHTHKLIL